MERNVVGIQVRKVRLSSEPKVTQKELIARLQVLGVMIDQSALSKIENGQRPVSDIEIIAFAKALRVKPSSLLEDSTTSSR
ncbi:MAG: hypothetical protein A2158_04615 [Chloroflexi bacterium RBG_13_46_14]|nr:MAG: hypothetical protein A2158_04615 [Chloroflexi bacterium RBG_13_46_14]